MSAFWHDFLNPVQPGSTRFSPVQPGVFALPSVLSPAGGVADALADLSGELIIGAALIFGLVMLLLARALRRRDPSNPVRPVWWIVGGGLAFPAVVVTALFFLQHRPHACLAAAATAGLADRRHHRAPVLVGSALP